MAILSPPPFAIDVDDEEPKPFLDKLLEWLDGVFDYDDDDDVGVRARGRGLRQAPPESWARARRDSPRPRAKGLPRTPVWGVPAAPTTVLGILQQKEGAAGRRGGALRRSRTAPRMPPGAFPVGALGSISHDGKLVLVTIKGSDLEPIDAVGGCETCATLPGAAGVCATCLDAATCATNLLE